MELGQQRLELPGKARGTLRCQHTPGKNPGAFGGSWDPLGEADAEAPGGLGGRLE